MVTKVLWSGIKTIACNQGLVCLGRAKRIERIDNCLVMGHGQCWYRGFENLPWSPGCAGVVLLHNRAVRWHYRLDGDWVCVRYVSRMTLKQLSWDWINPGFVTHLFCVELLLNNPTLILCKLPVCIDWVSLSFWWLDWLWSGYCLSILVETCVHQGICRCHFDVGCVKIHSFWNLASVNVCVTQVCCVLSLCWVLFFSSILQSCCLCLLLGDRSSGVFAGCLLDGEGTCKCNWQILGKCCFGSGGTFECDWQILDKCCFGHCFQVLVTVARCHQFWPGGCGWSLFFGAVVAACCADVFSPWGADSVRKNRFLISHASLWQCFGLPWYATLLPTVLINCCECAVWACQLIWLVI